MRPATERQASRLAIVAALALAACASAPPPREDVGTNRVPQAPSGSVLAQNGEYLVVVAKQGDDASRLAAQHLGDAGKSWWISDFNATERIEPGDAIVIPRKGPDPLGVTAQGFQTVPILCYHRFGPAKRRLVVTRADFEAQMEYLARNGYHVISLTRLLAFLEGREALPPKSVVITIDDGYRSTYEIAYPILRKFDFPATVFLYSDFIGAGDAMTWPQMQEMVKSGLVDIEPHSKTHSNLALRAAGETAAQYRERMRREVETPATLIGDRLGQPTVSYAYPYGDVTDVAVEQLQRQGLRMGVTVTPGGNAFFAYPYMLRRSMVFGTDDMEAFKSRLAVFSRAPRAP